MSAGSRTIRALPHPEHRHPTAARHIGRCPQPGCGGHLRIEHVGQYRTRLECWLCARPVYIRTAAQRIAAADRERFKAVARADAMGYVPQRGRPRKAAA